MIRLCDIDEIPEGEGVRYAGTDPGRCVPHR